MALGACYGSPMLNIILGISVGISLYLFSSNDNIWASSFSLEPVSNRIIFCLIVIILNLIMTIVYVILNSYKMDFRLGMILFSSYFIFIVVNLVLQD